MMNPLFFYRKFRFGRRRGATIVEYAMLITFIALAVAAVMGLMGVDLNTAYQNIREPFINR